MHCNDVIMSAIASQITSLTIVYSTVYSGAYQMKHQISASLAFVRRIHRWPVNSPRKGPVTRKMFPFNGVILCPNIIQYSHISKHIFSCTDITESFSDISAGIYSYIICLYTLILETKSSIRNNTIFWVIGNITKIYENMMTSSNGNIFRVTGHLCGKFTGPRWISRTKASDAELWCFLWFTPE